LIKSFVNANVDSFTSKKLAKSSRGILRLYLPTFIVSSGSLGCLDNFSTEVRYNFKHHGLQNLSSSRNGLHARIHKGQKEACPGV
jgi:hypothetical protein